MKILTAPSESSNNPASAIMEHLNILVEKIKNTKALQELYGDDRDELQKQVDRYTGLLERFQANYHHFTARVFSTPGRTEIGGNHTDHNHGCVLAGAVNPDNIAAATKNNSNIIRILSQGFPPFEIDLSHLNPNKGDQFTPTSLVRGISSRMKTLGYAIGGFDAVIDGGVPKGSGLSSSASFEVLTGTILNHLFNDGKIDPVTIAVIGQYAENNFFGKPCGLMDQIACALGGLISIDFKDPYKPVVHKINFDFASSGSALVITETGGSHAGLNQEYASLPAEMKSVALALGGKVLRDVSLAAVVEAIPTLRPATGDRAILRSCHFQGENQRVALQVEALERNDFEAFLQMVIESGQSSFMYNQNVIHAGSTREQGVALALALSEMILKGQGAWRVHGGGFAGTIQAFVPEHLLQTYVSNLEHVFGAGSCRKLFIRHAGSTEIEF